MDSMNSTYVSLSTDICTVPAKIIAPKPFLYEYWLRNTMDATEYMKFLDEIMPPYASYEMILNTSAKNGLQIPQ